MLSLTAEFTKIAKRIIINVTTPTPLRRAIIFSHIAILEFLLAPS